MKKNGKSLRAFFKTVGGPNRENQQGKDLFGGYGNLQGIFGNPSLVKNPNKNQEQLWKKQEKPKKNQETCILPYFL